MNNHLSDRHPTITLLSGPHDIFSHCCRIVLREKAVEYNVKYISVDDDPSTISEHNPYGEAPTLIDRDVTLYGISVIIEYLDERFPHPPLMPADPISRAKSRLAVHCIMRDLLLPVFKLGETKTPKLSLKLQKTLHDGLLMLSPIFVTNTQQNQTYFSGDDYSLIDAYVAPLLWRLPMLGIELPKQAEPLFQYAERLFKRPAFHASMSDQEIELR